MLPVDVAIVASIFTFSNRRIFKFLWCLEFGIWNLNFGSWCLVIFWSKNLLLPKTHFSILNTNYSILN